MKNYEVVRADSLSKLEHKVSYMIEQGYEAVGGVTFVPGIEYLQPMVLKPVIEVTINRGDR